MSQEFIALLTKGVQNRNSQESEKFEQLVIELRARDPPQFYFQCTEVFTNRNLDQELRQAAGTLLNMSLSEKDVEVDNPE
jgi:hypothetical protein